MRVHAWVRDLVIFRYAQVCNHPCLSYPPPYVYDSAMLVRRCGKFEVLDRMLVKLHATGHRVLLFSTMTKLLDLLEAYLAWRRWGPDQRAMQYLRIDGSTALEDRCPARAFDSSRRALDVPGWLHSCCGYLVLFKLRSAGMPPLQSQRILQGPVFAPLYGYIQYRGRLLQHSSPSNIGMGRVGRLRQMATRATGISVVSDSPCQLSARVGRK